VIDHRLLRVSTIYSYVTAYCALCILFACMAGTAIAWVYLVS